MEKRQRPTTYAEALEAKKYAEELQTSISDKEEVVKIDPMVQTSLNAVEVKTLPSQGKLYGDNPTVYFSPLSFGEMKFLSGSTLSDKESVEFFLNKIQTSFNKELLTYFDFYYITVLIKLSTYGEATFKVNYKCPNCKNVVSNSFNTADLNFEEIRCDLPAVITSRNGNKYSFSPMTVYNYLDLIKSGKTTDQDWYMAKQMIDVEPEEAYKIIREELNGIDIKILETLDVMFYHGVENLKLKCTNKVDGDSSEEVCGFISEMPFQSITNYINSIDSIKESIRDRISYGV
jgi:hypothetical protein